MKRILFSILSLTLVSSVTHAATSLKQAEDSLQGGFNQALSIGNGLFGAAKEMFYTHNHHSNICLVTGSEKVEFLNKIKSKFEYDNNATVQIVSMGSLEGAAAVSTPNAVAKETCVPNIWSPASSAYEQLVKFNLSRTGRSYLLSVPQTVKSPMVLVLRGRAYRAIAKTGVFKKDGNREYVTFSTMADLENKGTKIIVTRPGKSNSGFLSMLLAIHEAKGGDGDSVGPDDVDDVGLKVANSFFPKATTPATAQESNSFNSSGDLYKLFIDPANSTKYQGIVTYESLVVNSITQGASGLHVVYFETNAMSDHPAFVLSQIRPPGMSDADIEYADHQDLVAKKFLSFMIQPDQQREAAAEGFRPGVPRTVADIDVTKVWNDAVFGVGVAGNLGDDLVIIPRKIDGETIQELKDAAEKVSSPSK